MTVELVPNKQNFQDIYPSDSDDDEIDDSEDEQADPETEQIKVLEKKARQIDGDLERLNEEKRSASAQLTILKHYGDSMAKDRADDLGAFLSSYSTERKKAYDIILRAITASVHWRGNATTIIKLY